jgi:hypothetical protein
MLGITSISRFDRPPGLPTSPGLSLDAEESDFQIDKHGRVHWLDNGACDSSEPCATSQETIKK